MPFEKDVKPVSKRRRAERFFLARSKPPTKAQIKKKMEEQLKIMKGFLTTFLLAKDNLELNNTPAKRKRNVSIATKTVEEICKQNKITGETLGKIFG